MKRWAVIVLISINAWWPSWAIYPVIDASDLPIDIELALQQTYEVIEEIEKYQTMVRQLVHYYEQAEKLAKGDVSIEDFLVRTFNFHLQRDVVDLFWDYADADLEELVKLYDGAYDLKRQIDRLSQKFDDLFEGPRGIGSWSTGLYDLGGGLEDLQSRREAQIEHLRASIKQSLAWAGENKYAHDEDRNIYELTDRIWSGYQNDEDDDRGRQMMYDLINADLQTTKEVELKFQRVLQSFATTGALKHAKAQNELEQHLQASEALLEVIDEAIAGIEPISDQVVR